MFLNMYNLQFAKNKFMKIIIPIACVVILLSNFIYIVYSSSPQKAEQDPANIFTYRTPDKTIWVNRDNNVLERMRDHYISESKDAVASLEAEKQFVIPFNLLDTEVQQKLISNYNLAIDLQDKNGPRNGKSIYFLIFNSLIIISGFSLFYLFTFSRKSPKKDRFHGKTEGTTVLHHTHDGKGTSSVPGPAIIHSSKSAMAENVSVDDNQILNKIKDIICEILEYINDNSENSILAKTNDLEYFTSDQIQKVRASLTIDEFLSIEDEINNKIPIHFRAAADLIKAKFDELRAVLSGLASDFESVTKDNSNFSGQIKDSMSHIEKAIELDEIKEIRKKITGETTALRKAITKKQEKDTEMIKILSEKVKTMNKELAIVKEENQIDGLTQLYNRKTYDKKISEAFGKDQKPIKTFSVIMADLDYFKNINDEYGHTVGDEVLKRVSKTMKGTFRLNDFVARYGGEEFVVIVYRIDKQYVLDISERFRLDIEAINFKVDDESIPISVSIGVAFCKKTDTPGSLLKRADMALYLAKQSGRNTVKTQDDLPSSIST